MPSLGASRGCPAQSTEGALALRAAQPSALSCVELSGRLSAHAASSSLNHLRVSLAVSASVLLSGKAAMYLRREAIRSNQQLSEAASVLWSGRRQRTTT